MSRNEKKMKDQLDDEIKLAGLESLVPEEDVRGGEIRFENL